MADKKVTKVTKKMILEAIRYVAVNGDPDYVDFGPDITVDDVVDYVDTTLAQLEKKNEKAKERAAEKKADGDALASVIAGVLTDNLQTVDEIVTAVNAIDGYADVTKSKVVARLSQLIKANVARKEQVKIDTRKVMAYGNYVEPATENDETEAE